MNACEMVNRCLLAQWRGYGLKLQTAIQQMWKISSGNPGLVGSSGHHTYFLWWIDRPIRGELISSQEALMVVKEDVVPEEIMRNLQ